MSLPAHGNNALARLLASEHAPDNGRTFRSPLPAGVLARQTPPPAGPASPPGPAPPAAETFEEKIQKAADSGGKGAVCTLLRTDNGAHAGDAKALAKLGSLFGGEDLTLLTLLLKLGDESKWPAPVEDYQTPFDNAPQSSPEEKIIYNGRYNVLPGQTSHFHELTYSADTGGWDSAGGAKEKKFKTGRAGNRIDTGNVLYFLPKPFEKGKTATVKAEIKIRSTGRVVHTRTWAYTPRGDPPNAMAQSPGGGERALGSVYTYKLLPKRKGPGPYYEHQTVLEEFASRSSNLLPQDFKPEFLKAEGITTKAQIDAKFFSGSSNNGTFVADSNDEVHDQHGGGESMLDAAAAQLKAPKTILLNLPQVYSAGPGHRIGSYNVQRIRKADGSYALRKWQT